MPIEWIALGALLLLWVVWRVYGKSARITRAVRPRALPEVMLVPGRDSAFYRIEQALGERCSRRARDETMREWLMRIAAHVSDPPAREELAALMELHYRFRFDPAGVSQAEHHTFSARVDAWLARAMTPG